MRYIEDKNFKYKDELIKELRAYNLKHTGEKDSSTEYFYAIDGEKLVGSVYTEVESRVEEFKSIGFDIGGITERTPRTTRCFYLKNIDFDIKRYILKRAIQ
ncbi:hypothetical protein JK636_22715 [Clostridium sp. YIM B02515]|uniref:Uncharacterized protein n=1 Tax=Clostridium rhizosphaerae TaxID=2803861 RepID=A0ABS1TGL7_9CLOT|nr:hypothetical protein [Clostridium rhizosphaerae]MBL4938521.1 hypothetical protein [Clostridium rhizosphaerae]